MRRSRLPRSLAAGLSFIAGLGNRHQKSTKWVKGRVSGSRAVRSTAHWCKSSAGDTESSVQSRLARKNDAARAIAALCVNLQ